MCAAGACSAPRWFRNASPTCWTWKRLSARRCVPTPKQGSSRRLMSQAQQFCTFYLGPLFLGVEVERIQEVIRWQKMTRVPLALSEVSGLINPRGRILTAVDLRRRLGMEDRPADKKPMNVVVRTEDGAVSLLV